MLNFKQINDLVAKHLSFMSYYHLFGISMLIEGITANSVYGHLVLK